MCGFVLGQISRVIFIKPTLALQRMSLIKITFGREKTRVQGQKSKKRFSKKSLINLQNAKFDRSVGGPVLILDRHPGTSSNQELVVNLFTSYYSHTFGKLLSLKKVKQVSYSLQFLKRIFLQLIIIYISRKSSVFNYSPTINSHQHGKQSREGIKTDILRSG